MENSIFVQMASYRDSQLVPTLVNLIERAGSPEALRIVVCWQHAPEETLGEFWQRGFQKWRFKNINGRTVHFIEYQNARVELIDVPYLETQGCCWARNLIQQHYGDERYTLQLDSHHRFVQGWDQLAISMLESLRDESPKPILTTYLPGFDPDNDAFVFDAAPTIMAFDRFTPEGCVFFRGANVPDWETRERPVPSRFYSAHFAFADGHFAQAVQHDPEYFFHGEEISIAVRAFTHGYDLYHPHRNIAWHEYTRKHRPKMWDDHTTESKEEGRILQTWGERNDHCHQRNRALFSMDSDPSPLNNFGKYGFGSERTLAQYEAYAGLSFSDHGVHQETLDKSLPILNASIPDCVEEWKASLRRSHDFRVCLHHTEFDQHAIMPGDSNLLASATTAHFTARDDNDAIIHHKTLNSTELQDSINGDWLDYRFIFLSDMKQRPVSYLSELFDETGKVLSRFVTQIQA
jgi:hypothetical protein